MDSMYMLGFLNEICVSHVQAFIGNDKIATALSLSEHWKLAGERTHSLRPISCINYMKKQWEVGHRGGSQLGQFIF